MEQRILLLLCSILVVSCSQQKSMVRSTEINQNPVRVKQIFNAPEVKNEISAGLETESIQYEAVKEANQIQTQNEELVTLPALSTYEAPAVAEQTSSPLQSTLTIPSLHTQKKSAAKMAMFQAPKKAHWSAILSMVMGILGLVFVLPVIGSIAGIVFGIIAIKKIKAENSTYTGKDMAIVGIVTGVIGLLLTFLLILLFYVAWAGF